MHRRTELRQLGTGHRRAVPAARQIQQQTSRRPKRNHRATQKLPESHAPGRAFGLLEQLCCFHQSRRSRRTWLATIRSALELAPLRLGHIDLVSGVLELSRAMAHFARYLVGLIREGRERRRWNSRYPPRTAVTGLQKIGQRRVQPRSAASGAAGSDGGRHPFGRRATSNRRALRHRQARAADIT